MTYNVDKKSGVHVCQWSQCVITVIALAKHFPSLMWGGGAKEWWVSLEAAPRGERQFVLFLSL